MELGVIIAGRPDDWILPRLDQGMLLKELQNILDKAPTVTGYEGKP